MEKETECIYCGMTIKGKEKSNLAMSACKQVLGVCSTLLGFGHFAGTSVADAEKYGIAKLAGWYKFHFDCPYCHQSFDKDLPV